VAQTGDLLKTTNLHRVTSRKSGDLNCTAVETWMESTV